MRRARWWPLAVLVAAVACSSDGVKPGTFALQLNGPGPVRSVQVRLAGPQTAVVAGDSSITLFTSPLAGDTAVVIVVARAGQDLAAKSAIVHVTVPDFSRVPSYGFVLLQASAPNYSLLSPAAYTLVVH